MHQSIKVGIRLKWGLLVRSLWTKDIFSGHADSDCEAVLLWLLKQFLLLLRPACASAACECGPFLPCFQVRNRVRGVTNALHTISLTHTQAPPVTHITCLCINLASFALHWTVFSEHNKPYSYSGPPITHLLRPPCNPHNMPPYQSSLPKLFLIHAVFETFNILSTMFQIMIYFSYDSQLVGEHEGPVKLGIVVLRWFYSRVGMTILVCVRISIGP